MLVVSWNVAGRVKRLGEQAEKLLASEPDIVCLQELTPTTLPLWNKRLRRAGFTTVEHPAAAAAGTRSRPLFVLSACRQAARQLPVADVPWPERVLALELEDGTQLVNVHSPTSPKPGLAKVRTHLAVHRHLARADHRAALLCGDLNTPRKEHRDGTVWTFARDQYGRLLPERGEAWDEAELSLLRGLEPHGFVDAFRALHGYETREHSWEWRRWKGGYRLDHLLVAGLEVEECRYEHSWRREDLSDHSAVIGNVERSSPRSRAALAGRAGVLAGGE